MLPSLIVHHKKQHK